MIRQAVILAAGKGKRLNHSDPKPLVEVSGRPLIEHPIKKLLEKGVEVAVVISPRDEPAFRESLKNYKIKYLHQDQPLGTAHALFCARDFVKDDLFLVLMGDDRVTDFDSILQEKAPTVFGFEVEDVSSLGNIVSDPKGNFIEILEKKSKGKGLANTGV